MKKTSILGAMTLILSSGLAFADSSSNNAPPDKAELEAALKECSASSNGDQDAMDSCMTNKGFTKPSGPPPDGQNGDAPPGPPPDDSGSSSN